MILSGYLGETGIVDRMLGFGIGMFAWLYILYQIFYGEAAQLKEETEDENVKDAFDSLKWIVTVGWSIYPIGYLLNNKNIKNIVINEEIIRLKSHMKLFSNYFNSKNIAGKKMNFILQEMTREINTIGSKTDKVKINHYVVDVKDNIEKNPILQKRRKILYTASSPHI